MYRRSFISALLALVSVYQSDHGWRAALNPPGSDLEVNQPPIDMQVVRSITATPFNPDNPEQRADHLGAGERHVSNIDLPTRRLLGL